jgi:hypothetical protein
MKMRRRRQRRVINRAFPLCCLDADCLFALLQFLSRSGCSLQGCNSEAECRILELGWAGLAGPWAGYV